ncbi:E3 ubiquitin-protein ligase itt1 [Erysiphe neolycopersici]|uniref:RBR-type E3 ubiquitin transferase n=1 Tax=Erysiphe neolycopersici TaxID=212602 RepID=A0A420HJ43_9PEZI|nr:E3 ubiquitin-protein ligase itt1 [Erysiphe neolycopersici]
MDDRRQVELDCLSYIFPEIQKDPINPFTARIALPVRPRNCVNVIFSSALDIQSPITSATREQKCVTLSHNIKSYSLSYLPPLNLSITLADDYPERSPPEINLFMNPKWLSDKYLNQLKLEARNIWDKSSGSEVLYEIIDFLQQATENAFGYSEKDQILEVPEELRISLLDFDINETQAVFKSKTFHCSICLDPKKGNLCHQMLDCKHIFCIECLQEFYLNAINTGDIVSVRCLAPGCFKKLKETQGDSKKQPKIKTLSPSELLQISLDKESVTRFVKLKHKLELESDKSTVYCPRKWCEGAARSSKHHRSLSLDDTSNLYEQSETDIENPEKPSTQNKLSVCEDCLFAFCNRCFQSWHGDFTLCVPKPSGELSEDDKASLNYLKYHTTACPTCEVPSQKSYGCNHMICFRCNTHFCYLCSNWLSPSNPYKHYNTISSSCYMRLWELEEGDAEDEAVNIAERRPNIGLDDNHLIQEAEIPILAIQDVQEAPVVEGAIDEPQAPNLPEMQREGPLVLRINHLPRQAQIDLAIRPVEVPPKGPNRGRRNLHLRGPPRRTRGEDDAQPQPHANQLLVAEGGAHHGWVRRFVELALNDEEDLIDWSSDDELDPIAWEIPIR